MLWFGLGIWPQILLVALGVSAILGVQTYEAIRNMPIVYVRAAFNLGATKRGVFRTIVIPYIIPHLVGAIRVAAATSWGLGVAAEFMGVQIGLGFTMIVQQMYMNTPGIIVIVLIYSIMAITFDQIIRQIEKRVTYWTDRQHLSFDGLN
jgi:ABC-type nitrate/sulfonate/bicarbonate transport system permease component